MSAQTITITNGVASPASLTLDADATQMHISGGDGGGDFALEGSFNGTVWDQVTSAAGSYLSPGVYNLSLLTGTRVRILVTKQPTLPHVRTVTFLP